MRFLGIVTLNQLQTIQPWSVYVHAIIADYNTQIIIIITVSPQGLKKKVVW